MAPFGEVLGLICSLTSPPTKELVREPNQELLCGTCLKQAQNRPVWERRVPEVWFMYLHLCRLTQKRKNVLVCVNQHGCKYINHTSGTRRF